MSTYARIGRVVAAAMIATTCAALALAWLYRPDHEPVPIVRCPIHGIAYDAELEVCPECAKTWAAATGPEHAGPQAHYPEATRGAHRRSTV